MDWFDWAKIVVIALQCGLIAFTLAVLAERAIRRRMPRRDPEAGGIDGE